ncbi:hypothetical protein HMPREF9709_00293 [Helcococcus kunzii ATCC 51366]|uniref:Uncharacterized protein n=1 Tax=Helcococcus kunzii ATCC 51366 TaxID=883114 RepID=H3NLT2_9FIRM|nr:hypothetical protein [Helcococcus kunzii]EHR35602.1 hypothetical protein HMPREF9709_00293 [Helcococcus kunzii ATCC 51366]
MKSKITRIIYICLMTFLLVNSTVLYAKSQNDSVKLGIVRPFIIHEESYTYSKGNGGYWTTVQEGRYYYHGYMKFIKYENGIHYYKGTLNMISNPNGFYFIEKHKE